MASKAGFSVQDVEQIAEDYKEEGQCLEQVVRQWLRTGVSWTQVVQLLSLVGDKEQASQLATQKGQLHTHTRAHTHEGILFGSGRKCRFL